MGPKTLENTLTLKIRTRAKLESIRFHPAKLDAENKRQTKVNLSTWNASNEWVLGVEENFKNVRLARWVSPNEGTYYGLGIDFLMNDCIFNFWRIGRLHI